MPGSFECGFATMGEGFHTHHPDIALMDLQLPTMHGIDRIVAIRSEFPEARMIVLTS